MYTIWTKHIEDPNEKIEFEKTVFGSKRVLNRLKDLLKEQEDALNIAEVSPKNYEIPNWDYRQAHNNGYRQCLNVLKKLVDLDQQLPTMEDINGRNTNRRPGQAAAAN
jgi:hypothetical protein